MASTGEPENRDYSPDSTMPATNSVEQMMEETRKKKVVDWVKNTHGKMKQDRIRIEQQWQLNLAFYFGNQNVIHKQMGSVVTGPGQGGLWTPGAPQWRARPIFNRIRPTARTEMSKLTAQKPNAFIIPASSEDRDLYAAQAGEQIWETLYRNHNISKVLRNAVFWVVTCGTGFMKAYWDPSKVDEANQLQGDLCFESETPWNIYVPNQREQDIEKQPYIIHAMKKSKDWAKLTFPGVDPKSGSGVAAAAEPVVIYDTELFNEGAATKEQNDVLVIEMWVKPGATPQFPEGALLTVVGDTLVQEITQWPMAAKEYPFAKIEHIPTGKFYSDSSIVDLIPLQREYNRTRGQIIESKNAMARPRLMAERGSIDPTKITSAPGQVILYEAGFNPPTNLPMEALPNYVMQELDRTLSDWADISGIHEVSQGQVPAGVTAATAISYLQEQDETKLAYTVASIEEAMQKVAHLTLLYVQQYWTAPRALKVIGLDGSFDYLAFKGSDLRDNTDIQIEAGSALPTSRAAKQAFLLDLFKLGAISPEQMLDLMDMGGINRLRERIMVDKKQAQRENLKMTQITPEMLEQHLEVSNEKAFQEGYIPGPEGLPTDPITGEVKEPELIVPVNTWDNHAIHIEEHNNYRKGQAYENLSDESKALFDLHVEQHLDMVAAMQAGLQPPDPMMGGGAPPGMAPPEDGGMPPGMEGPPAPGSEEPAPSEEEMPPPEG